MVLALVGQGHGGGWPTSGGSGGGNPPTSITFIQGTVLAGAPIGTMVGTAVATGQQPPASVVTWSLTDDYGGTYAIDASTGVVTTAATVTAGTDPITIAATTSYGSYSQPFGIVISTSAGIQSGSLTYQEQSGSAQPAGVPMHFIWPVSATSQPTSGQRVQVLDGGTPIPTETNFTCSDNDGNMRVIGCTAVLQNPVTGGGSYNFTVEGTTSAAPTGTAIQLSDVLASDFECTITVTDQSGTVWVGTATDMLQASTTWSGTNNGGNSYLRGPYREGVYTYSWTGSIALKNAGSGHAFLRVEAECIFSKAGSGAVESGNPITQARCNLDFENANLYVASPSDMAYGVTIVMGKASQTTALDMPILQPDDTLTVTGTGKKQALSTTSYAFTLDAIGSMVVAGDGLGAVIAVPTSTSLTTNNLFNSLSWTNSTYPSQVVQAPPIPAASYTSGNWSIYPINHIYSGKWSFTAWWGNNNAHYAVPDPSLLRSTKLFMNWAAPATNWTAPSLSVLNSQAVSTTPFKRPFRCTSDYFGDFLIDIDSGGQDGAYYINVFPSWGIILCTEGGWSSSWVRMLEEDYQAYGLISAHFRNETTGGFIDFSALPIASLYHNDTNLLIPPASSRNPVSYTYGAQDPSHFADPAFPIWLLSGGQLTYVRDAQHKAQWMWLTISVADTSATGYGRVPSALWGQERSVAWAMRTIVHAGMMTPDTVPAGYHDKAHFSSYITAEWSYIVNNLMTLAIYGTLKYRNIYPLPSGPRFTSGLWFHKTYAMWMLYRAHELGWTDTNGEDVISWINYVYQQVVLTTGDEAQNCPNFLMGAYDIYQAYLGTGSTFASMYQKTANSYAQGNGSGNTGLSIASISGSDATTMVVLSAPYFISSESQNFGIGGWVIGAATYPITTSNPILGAGQITAIDSDGMTLTVDTTVGAPPDAPEGSAGGVAFDTTPSGYGYIQLPFLSPDLFPDGYFPQVQDPLSWSGQYGYGVWSIVNLQKEYSADTGQYAWMQNRVEVDFGVTGGIPNEADTYNPSLGGDPAGRTIISRV